MKTEKFKNLNQLTMKDLAKDLFQAVTDVEGRLLKTVTQLSVSPEKIIFGYLGHEKKSYIPVFRYLLFSVFVSFCQLHLLHFIS